MTVGGIGRGRHRRRTRDASRERRLSGIGSGWPYLRTSWRSATIPLVYSFHLHEVQGDILVEPVEEWDPFTDQDGHDRIANFVGQSEPKAFTRDGTPSDEPDATEGRFQPLLHQVREIARVELDRIPGPRQLATGQDERRLVAIGPTESLGLEVQCGLVGARAHDVAVNRLEELLDELRVQGVPVLELV